MSVTGSPATVTYNRAFTVEEAVAQMRSEQGTHFDPWLLDLFLVEFDELLFIRSAHPDRADDVILVG